MDARHGRTAPAAPHPAHIAHDNTLPPALIPALRLPYHIPHPEYAGLTSPALESGEWHTRLACALRRSGDSPEPPPIDGNPPPSSFAGLRRAGITSVQEVIPGGMNVTSAFGYDYENRLTEYAVGGTNFSVEHTYDGYNRVVWDKATLH